MKKENHVTSNEALQDINKALLSLAETSTIVRVLDILQKIDERAKHCETIEMRGLLERDIAAEVVSFLNVSSLSDIGASTVVESNVSEKEIVENVRRILAIMLRVEAAKELQVTMVKLKDAVIARAQRNMDEAFNKFEIFKADKIEGFRQQLKEHDRVADQLRKHLRELDEIISSSSRIVQDIDNDLSSANSERASASTSSSYRLGEQIRDLSRKRKHAISKLDELKKERKSVEARLDEECSAIKKLNDEISKTNNSLPSELKKESENLERLKRSFDNSELTLRSAISWLENYWNVFVQMSETLRPGDEFHRYDIDGTNVSIGLIYLPLVFVELTGLVSIKKHCIVTFPGKLPNTDRELVSGSLFKYSERLLDNLSPADLKEITMIAHSRNFVTIPKGKETLRRGLATLRDDGLISGIEKDEWEILLNYLR
jgi:hypothetical protein